jgi:hypothetical protein
MRSTLLVLTMVMAAPSPGGAQQTEPTHEEKADLAKQLSNPPASLVSMPFQFNWEQNVGASRHSRSVTRRSIRLATFAP